jgi:hypothetical protein
MRSLTAVLFAFTLSWPALADEPKPVAPPAPTEDRATPASPEPVVSSGVRVYIDPETGRRTTTPTEAQRRASAAQDALNRNLEGHDGFTEETLPSGAVMLRTHGRHQSVVIAKPGSDGRARIECTDPLHEHVQAASNTQSVPANDER